MGDIVYVAPLKKGLSLGDMLGILSKGHGKTFDAAVVIHGDGPWDRQIWESSPRHPSGKKLNHPNDAGLHHEVTDALEYTPLFLYAEKHADFVSNGLTMRGYSVVQLAYESNLP